MPNNQELLEKFEELHKSNNEAMKTYEKKLEQIEKDGKATEEVKAIASKAADDITNLQKQMEDMQKSIDRDRAVDNIKGESGREKTERYAKYIKAAEKGDAVANCYKRLYFNEKGEYDEEKADARWKAFELYMLSGDSGPLKEIDHKAGVGGLDGFKSMNVVNPSGGGFLIPPVMGELIVHTIAEFSPFHQYVDTITILANEIQWPLTNRRTGARRAHELQSRSETDAPTFQEFGLKPEDLYAEPRVTQRMLDLRMDLETWLAQVIADEFIITEADEMANGSGVGECRGFLTYANGTTTSTIQQLNSGAAADIDDPDKIRQFDALLKPAYGPESRYYGRRSTFSSISQIKDGTGRYVWQPGLQAGNPGLLMGRPTVMAEDIPAIGADALALVLANLKKGYKFVQMPGMRLIRDEFTAKPFILFNTTKRSDGGVPVTEAIKIMKCAV